MGRKVRDRDLSDRAARRRLPAQKAPHWRALSLGRHLGYRRLAKGAGSWIARLYLDGAYLEHKLGLADDFADADGSGVLDFSQAQEAANRWYQERLEAHQRALDPDAASGPYSVADAMRDYLKWYTGHKKDIANAQRVTDTHILPALGALEVSKLTTRKLRLWHQALAEQPARRRSRKGAETPNFAPPAATPEAKRRRKVTANHIRTVLVAALNLAFYDGRVASDFAWRRLRPFQKVDQPRISFLTGDEAKRLVNACDGDFRQLVVGALVTGARYGELVKLRARDYDPDAATIYVDDPKSGRPRHVHLSAEGVDLFEQLTAGRPAGGRVFLNDGKPWGRSHQHRRMSEACERAKLEHVGFHMLRHFYGSQLAREGVDLPVIAAQLGHADTRITHRHYIHLAPSHVAATVKRALPKLGVVPKSKVARHRSR